MKWMITMTLRKRQVFVINSIWLLLFLSSCQSLKKGSYPDPTRFEKDILTFEQQDSLQMPPEQAVVCTGSSSMLKWHEWIREDLAPLTVIPRGFGGSTMWDLNWYADRIVLKYHPRAVLIYEGDNDIADSVPPEKVSETFLILVKKIHNALPECRIYFISIKPSIARWKLWPEMEKANRLIESMCRKDPNLTYIDVSAKMLDENGLPRKDIFQEDELHMNRRGYMIWKSIIRPVLLDKELRYEKDSLAVPENNWGGSERSGY